MRDVNQFNISKPDEEVQPTPVVPWNISEIRGSGVGRGERSPQHWGRAADLLRIYIALHPTASIWNRAASEGDESHRKVMVQLERIKETTEINQFQEGEKFISFTALPTKS